LRGPVAPGAPKILVNSPAGRAPNPSGSSDDTLAGPLATGGGWGLAKISGSGCRAKAREPASGPRSPGPLGAQMPPNILVKSPLGGPPAPDEKLEGGVEEAAGGGACTSPVNSPGVDPGAAGGIWGSEAGGPGGPPRTIVNSPSGGGGEGLPPSVSIVVQGCGGVSPVAAPRSFSQAAPADGMTCVASNRPVPVAARGLPVSTVAPGIEPAGASSVLSDRAGARAGTEPTTVTSFEPDCKGCGIT